MRAKIPAVAVRVVLALALPATLTSCATPGSGTASSPSTTPRPAATATLRPDGLSEAEAQTLASLQQLDDYPLYAMTYVGDYGEPSRPAGGQRPGSTFAWACSLFAALGDRENLLFGRNFDWEYSPALILFTTPSDGYAAVSMVDIAYLGFAGPRARDLTGLPLDDLRPLLAAPFLPFDGLNERGVAIGMAAVPPGNVTPDPGQETVGSLEVMRLVLDQAADVDQALTVLQRYNIDMGGGPPVHYLVADRSGRALLVEFHRGEMVVLPNQDPWHVATNFLLASVGSPDGVCNRYDSIAQRLAETDGRLSTSQAMGLLHRVSQDLTQWSAVYDMSAGQVQVAMGRAYALVYTFGLYATGQ